MKAVICLTLLVVVASASVIRETQTGLGSQVEGELKTVLAQIEATVDQGKTVAKDLLEKGHTLLDQAKTLGGQVWHTAQGELAKLNDAASSVFGNFLKTVSDFWHEIQHVIGKRSAERRFLLDDIKAFNARLSKDMQGLFTDINSHLRHFNEYIGSVFQSELHKAQPVIDNVKGIAESFLNATEAKSQDVISQAKTFFEPYKHDIGELWTEIECEYQHVVHSGPACATPSRRDVANLEADLKKVLADIEQTVKTGGTVAHDLLNKGKTLLEQAKTVGGTVWENSKGELSKLTGEASTILKGFLQGVSHLWSEIHTMFGKRETQTDIGAHLQAELQDVLKQIEKTVDDGKTVAHELLEKGHTILGQAKTIGGQVWQNAKGELSKLNDAASSIFSNFLKTASDFWHEIVHSFGKREMERRFLLDNFHDLYVHLSQDLQSIFTNVGTKFHAFNQYLQELFQKQASAAKPVVDNIKTLAHNFLTATKEKSQEVVTQAKTFFEPYKHDLGELWGQVECTYNHVVHNAAADCHDTPAY